MKVYQVEKASKFVRIKIDLQISNHILIVKVKQVEKRSGSMQGKGDMQNVNLKDDAGIKDIERLYNQKFKK